MSELEELKLAYAECSRQRNELLNKLKSQAQQQEPVVTVLPDGSAFSVASFPLPHDHWLYAPYQYMPGHDDPVELPSPVVTHADRDRVVAAIRYAVRGATMCGKEPDFDPDALVQNATYALCGPFNAAHGIKENT